MLPTSPMPAWLTVWMVILFAPLALLLYTLAVMRVHKMWSPLHYPSHRIGWTGYRGLGNFHFVSWDGEHWYPVEVEGNGKSVKIGPELEPDIFEKIADFDVNEMVRAAQRARELKKALPTKKPSETIPTGGGMARW